MDDIPTLTKRQLQAAVIKPIYEEMVAVLGDQTAQSILGNAIRKAAIAEAGEFANKAPDGKTSLRSFIDLFELWTAGGALEIEVHEESDVCFSFDVTRCQYAETYREMGIGQIGHLLSCNRDGSFCEGYDSNIKLDRRQTIMSGSDRCTFRYRYEFSSSLESSKKR
jgi:hypothetical protein